MPLTLLLLNIHTLATILMQEEIASDFNDLGKLLLGGFALAVAVALALTFVRLRLRDKKVPTSEFISISSVEREGAGRFRLLVKRVTNWPTTISFCTDGLLPDPSHRT